MSYLDDVCRTLLTFSTHRIIPDAKCLVWKPQYSLNHIRLKLYFKVEGKKSMSYLFKNPDPKFDVNTRMLLTLLQFTNFSDIPTFSKAKRMCLFVKVSHRSELEAGRLVSALSFEDAESNGESPKPPHSKNRRSIHLERPRNFEKGRVRRQRLEEKKAAQPNEALNRAE